MGMKANWNWQLSKESVNLSEELRVSNMKYDQIILQNTTTDYPDKSMNLNTTINIKVKGLKKLSPQITK